MELTGKRIVITGAPSGIGWELTKRLCRAGARVVGVSRHPARIEAELGAYGARAVACDVSDPRQIDAMLAEARAILGGIDVFIANAGFAYYGGIGAPDWEKNERIFRTNVLSPVYTLQKLTEGGGAERLTFMITVSALGKMVLPGFALYNATKFALDGFVRTYRMEKPARVTIIPVYPVANFTPFFRKAGGADTPVPLLARQFPGWTAACMEFALRVSARAVYPSLIFIARCILARVTPIDVPVQLLERIRLHRWRVRHGEKTNH